MSSEQVMTVALLARCWFHSILAGFSSFWCLRDIFFCHSSCWLLLLLSAMLLSLRKKVDLFDHRKKIHYNLSSFPFLYYYFSVSLWDYYLYELINAAWRAEDMISKTYDACLTNLLNWLVHFLERIKSNSAVWPLPNLLSEFRIRKFDSKQTYRDKMCLKAVCSTLRNTPT